MKKYYLYKKYFFLIFIVIFIFNLSFILSEFIATCNLNEILGGNGINFIDILNL